jgi:hypothetical protein
VRDYHNSAASIRETLAFAIFILAQTEIEAGWHYMPITIEDLEVGLKEANFYIDGILFLLGTTQITLQPLARLTELARLGLTLEQDISTKCDLLQSRIQASGSTSINGPSKAH